MAKITFQEAPQRMLEGVVGIGEHHDNHWGRMLVLKLLQCPGARHLLIEAPPDQQDQVDAIITEAGAFDEDAAAAFGAQGWTTTGVLPLSMVVYQAQRRGVKVVCADHTCVYSGTYAVSKPGMNKRNGAAVQTLLGLADSPEQLNGIIMLNGTEHFQSGQSQSIARRLQAHQDLRFHWVDASTKEGSGFGVSLN